MDIVDWAPGLRVGAGYDVVRGDEKQEAVVGQLEKPLNASGQQGDSSFLLATSSDEVDTALDVNASIKVGAGPFGGSAKMDFHKRCKVSNEATFCVISVHATNAYEQLVRPKLSPEAEALLAAGKKDRFRERFGDSFVSGQYTGIEFYGVVRIEASTKSKKSELAAKVQASYGLMASGKVSTTFNESMSSSSHRIEVQTFQTGGEIRVCSDISEMMGAASAALQAGREGRGYPFKVKLDPFTELQLPNDDASLIDTEMAAKSVKMAMSYISALGKMLNDIDYVRQHQGWYDSPDMNHLNQCASQISGEINRLWESADNCSKHFDQCTIAVPSFPEFVMPKPKEDAAPAIKISPIFVVGKVKKAQLSRSVTVNPRLLKMRAMVGKKL